MSDAQNVSTAKPKVGGAAYTAPFGTTLPTNAITKLDPVFKSLGYISEDGLTNTNSPDSDSIKAWGGATVAVVDKGKEDTFQYTLIEVLNIDVLKEIYGEDNVKGDLATGISIDAGSDPYEPHVLVFDMILKGGVLKRIVVPSATISEVGDIAYTDEDAIGFETTITATPDATGKSHHDYMQNSKGEDTAPTEEKGE